MTDLQNKIVRIKKLDKDLIPEAIEDMDRFKAIATVCTPRYENDETQHTAASENSKEKAFSEYTEASIKVDKLQDEIADLKIEVQKQIDLIPDDKQRRFAKLYYIDQLTQKGIAKKSHYAYSTVKNNMCAVNKVLSSTVNAIE